MAEKVTLKQGSTVVYPQTVITNVFTEDATPVALSAILADKIECVSTATGTASGLNATMLGGLPASSYVHDGSASITLGQLTANTIKVRAPEYVQFTDASQAGYTTLDKRIVPTFPSFSATKEYVLRLKVNGDHYEMEWAEDTFARTSE